MRAPHVYGVLYHASLKRLCSAVCAARIPWSDSEKADISQALDQIHVRYEAVHSIPYAEAFKNNRQSGKVAGGFGSAWWAHRRIVILILTSLTFSSLPASGIDASRSHPPEPVWPPAGAPPLALISVSKRNDIEVVQKRPADAKPVVKP